MSTQVVVAVASAAVALLSAVVAGLMTSWSAHRTRRYESLIEAQQKAQSKAEQAEMVLSRYREPLLSAAHNLQARLYNIVEQTFLTEYLHCGDHNLERYARDYTVYVLAEYLCWAEIIRRDLRFLDLGSEIRNRDLVRLLEATQRAPGRLQSPFSHSWLTGLSLFTLVAALRLCARRVAESVFVSFGFRRGVRRVAWGGPRGRGAGGAGGKDRGGWRGAGGRFPVRGAGGRRR